MTRIFVVLTSTCTLALASCVNDPTTQDVGDHLRRGLSGQGQLGPIDRSDDPNPRAPGAAPTPP